MNQNQIDRLYKVAISRNAYVNKMATEMTAEEYANLDAGPKIPAAGSPDADAAAFTAEGERQGAIANAAAGSTTGFNFETFKKILQNPNVQMGAGLGAAGLAGYGIYKHLNKKKKRDEAYA